MRSSTAKGWNVYDFRGAVRLMVRLEGQPSQSVILPFDWAKASVGDVLARVRSIYALTADGHSLKAAADIADGRAPKPVMDWAGAVERFRLQKMEHGRAVKLVTWNHSYAPVLADAIEVLNSPKAPTSPEDLLDQMIRPWATGSRMRQIRAQALAQFLRHCVSREGFPVVWMPPTDLRAHVGVRPTQDLNRSKGDPIEDQQIINLIASLPSDAAGVRWADALRLLAELGLRPIELLHLSVQKDRSTGQPYWWCSYRKRSGGGDTEPRRVHPLPLVDSEGQVQRWKLIDRWQAGLIELPPLSSGTGAGDALGTYLNLQPGWCSLKAILATKGERLVPYSLRHSYSLRGHLRGVDAGSVALSMGHSFEVHCRAYPWASQSGTAAAFERANAALLAIDPSPAR